MKKLFPLKKPGRADARVVDAVKHEVNKYVRRERAKALPEGFDRWDFACRVGPDRATAEPRTLKEVSRAIDAVALTDVSAVYLEILAVPAKWDRPVEQPTAADPAGDEPDDESPTEGPVD